MARTDIRSVRSTSQFVLSGQQLLLMRRMWKHRDDIYGIDFDMRNHSVRDSLAALCSRGIAERTTFVEPYCYRLTDRGIAWTREKRWKVMPPTDRYNRAVVRAKLMGATLTKDRSKCGNPFVYTRSDGSVYLYTVFRECIKHIAYDEDAYYGPNVRPFTAGWNKEDTSR